MFLHQSADTLSDLRSKPLPKLKERCSRSEPECLQWLGELSFEEFSRVIGEVMTIRTEHVLAYSCSRGSP